MKQTRFDFDFWCFNATFSNISAISWGTVFSGGRSRSTRREPPTMGKATGQLFYHLRLRVECTLFVIYKTEREPT
jgi:hypothetical protein